MSKTEEMDLIEISRVRPFEGEDEMRIRIVHGTQVTQVTLSLEDFAACITGRSTPCEVGLFTAPFHGPQAATRTGVEGSIPEGTGEVAGAAETGGRVGSTASVWNRTSRGSIPDLPPRGR